MTPPQQIERQEVLTTAYTNYQKGLNVHAFFKLNDRTISEELVQDAFLKTWKYLAKGGKIKIMRAFLYHVLNALIIDEYRKSKTSSLDVLLEKGFEPSDGRSGALPNFLDGRRAVLLIKHLPISYRKVMRMRYVQDLSLKEMALLTGQTKNALAVQAHRGLLKLKLLYEYSWKTPSRRILASL